jgi:hypothetical protein
MLELLQYFPRECYRSSLITPFIKAMYLIFYNTQQRSCLNQQNVFENFVKARRKYGNIYAGNRSLFFVIIQIC